MKKFMTGKLGDWGFTYACVSLKKLKKFMTGKLGDWGVTLQFAQFCSKFENSNLKKQ